jgi:phospholipase C
MGYERAESQLQLAFSRFDTWKGTEHMNVQEYFSLRQTRRGHLRYLGTLVGASLALHACGGPSSQPASAPVTAGPGSIQSLKHIVIACQENRTFDTYFGSYAKAGRFGIPPDYSQPDGKGGRVRPHKFQLDDTADVAHDWHTIHREWDHGNMDGFYLANGANAFGYYDRSDLAYYYGLADAFTLCGNYFGTASLDGG